jgi:hypothetical protein
MKTGNLLIVITGVFEEFSQHFLHGALLHTGI